MADASGLRRALEQRTGYIALRLRGDVDRELHANAAAHRKSGEMERHLKVTQARVSPTVWRVTAQDDVIQAATTDRGARPHEIRPRTAAALRFVVGGRVVFAKVVHHPGNPPSHWFSRVMSEQHITALLTRFVGR